MVWYESSFRSAFVGLKGGNHQEKGLALDKLAFEIASRNLWPKMCSILGLWFGTLCKPCSVDQNLVPRVAPPRGPQKVNGLGQRFKLFVMAM